MVNWKEIHPDFTRKLQKEWKDRGFDYEEVKKWADALEYFEPNDYDFCTWLRDEKELTAETLDYNELNELMEEYNNEINETSNEKETSEEESEDGVEEYNDAQENYDQYNEEESSPYEETDEEELIDDLSRLNISEGRRVRPILDKPNFISKYSSSEDRYDYPPSPWWQSNWQNVPGQGFINWGNHYNIENCIYPDYGNSLKESIRKYKNLLNPPVGSGRTPWLVELPTKIYDIKKNTTATGVSSIGSIPYAVLSYSWGSQKSLATWKINSGETLPITNLGFKSLNKAVAVCNHLDISYLWIDQFCINQEDEEEVNREKKEMKNYYGHSTVTLIAIHIDIGKEDFNNPEEIIRKIVSSKWFSRSWTFQEGLLSQRTLFMFDDCLVDGTVLAQVWASDFSSKQKIATPLGWAYYEDGYGPSIEFNDNGDRIILTLKETLKGIEGRGHSEKIDGIYSVLGLLPYGERVVTKYKPKTYWQFDHMSGSWYSVDAPCEYNKQEIESALQDVVNCAREHGEELNWYWNRDYEVYEVTGSILVRKKDLNNTEYRNWENLQSQVHQYQPVNYTYQPYQQYYPEEVDQYQSQIEQPTYSMPQMTYWNRYNY